MNTVMLLAYGMIVMILMSLGVALTQMKVFSFKDALITSTGRVIIGPYNRFYCYKNIQFNRCICWCCINSVFYA